MILRDDIMKRLVCITGIILISCVLIGALYTPSKAVNTVAEELVTQPDKETVSFILKAENNLIVVYIKGESTPFMVTDTYVNNLPKNDILLLNEGIEIQGEKNLQKSLQDYCS